MESIAGNFIGGNNSNSFDRFDLLYKTYSPEFNIKKFGELTVIDDSVLIGGTKQRIFSYYIGTLEEEEIVYAGTSMGYGMIALAIAGKIWSKKITIFVHSTKKSELVNIAKYLGATIIAKNCTLKEIELDAANYIKPGMKLLNLGGEGSRHSDIFKCYQWAMKPLTKMKINKLWIVAGSGFTYRVIKSLLPEVEFKVVQVGKKLYDCSALVAPEKFTEVASILPPYDSLSTYDAKLWQFARNQTGTIFNIAGNPKPLKTYDGITAFDKEILYLDSDAKFNITKHPICQKEIYTWIERNSKPNPELLFKQLGIKKGKGGILNVCHMTEAKMGFRVYFYEIIHFYEFELELSSQTVFNPLLEVKLPNCKLVKGKKLISHHDKEIIPGEFDLCDNEIELNCNFDPFLVCDVELLPGDKIETILGLNVIYGLSCVKKLLKLVDNTYNDYDEPSIKFKKGKVKQNKMTDLCAWIYDGEVVYKDGYYSFLL